MPTMITYGTELIRIGARGALERSLNGGRSWLPLYMGSACGDFRDLVVYGKELLAVTSKGIYASSNGGQSWMMRYVGSACGEFLTLLDGGGELLVTTTKGLYRSTNGGSTWLRR